MYFAVFFIQDLFDKLKKVCLEKEVLRVLDSAYSIFSGLTDSCILKSTMYSPSV